MRALKATGILLIALLSGCGKTASDDSQGGGAGDGQFQPPPALDEAGIPSWANARFDINGFPGMGGDFQLNVGPDGHQSFTYAGNGGAGTGVSISGEFKLDDKTRYGASAAPSSLSWATPNDEAMLSSTSQFTLTRSGSSLNYLTRSVSISVSAAGVVTAEVTGVGMDRVDMTTGAIKPGADTVVHVQGKLSAACRVHKDPTNPSSAVLLDPTNSSSDCQTVLKGL